jgi:hypothetical protein
VYALNNNESDAITEFVETRFKPTYGKAKYTKTTKTIAGIERNKTTYAVINPLIKTLLKLLIIAIISPMRIAKKQLKNDIFKIKINGEIKI